MTAVGVLLVASSAWSDPPAVAATRRPAGDKTTNSLKAKRRQVQQQKATLAGQINVIKATDAQVQQALDALDSNVAGQTARVASARQAVTVANRRLAAAEKAERRTQAHLDRLKDSLRSAAVQAYVRGDVVPVSVILDAVSVRAAVQRQALYDSAVSKATDVADQLRATREDLGVKRAEADQARTDAVTRRLDEESSLNSLKQAQAAQQKVADQLETRLDQALSEADALDAVDHQLAAQIQAREAALAARIANRTVGAGAGRRGTHLGAVQVTSVRGIVVNVQIADQVAALLAAADTAGLSLSGGGYRDPQAQLALRAAHCGGSSDYDVYDKPPSQCHPPTARPGNSMHEVGLAIDFTTNGHIISSHSDPAWQWLAANAARFGLHNLRSEPWHWSTNGN